jgi:regulator of sigma E protease
VTTILAFLFVLGVLIFVHELGHFLAARRIGVRVLTFSLGFGPKILKFRRGDTEYCISVIPLGGYVKMAGETVEDERTGKPDEFLSKSKWERFQVLIMGPLMNVLLAIVVLAIVFGQGVQMATYLDEPPVVGLVTPGSAAEKAGIRPGDRVLTVAGDEMKSWKDLRVAIGMKAKRDVDVTLLREGQNISVTVHPDAQGRYEIGDIGVLPDAYPIISAVEPDQTAGKAGIKKDDLIVAANGERIVFSAQFVEATRKNIGKQMEVTVRRDGQDLRFTVVPEMRDNLPRIGISLINKTTFYEPGPVEAVQMSLEENWESSGLIFRTLGGLFTGETSLGQFQGPIGIAQLSGESAQAGWVALLSLMAMISLNLGIINLMPVPVLDGGHILIMALEGVARRDFSVQMKEKMLLAGFVVLMMLMVTVIYNDLTRISWIERLMPWRN